jgi:hypothetical protein
MSVLEIRGDGPRRRIIRVNQIQDGFVILEERGRGCLKKGGRGRHFSGVREIAAGNHRNGIGIVDRIRRGPGQPCVPVRIKSVVPRQCKSEWVGRIVQLGAAADGRLLAPQEPAFDVHVLEGKGILGANQGRQLAALYRKAIVRRDLEVRHWQWPEEITRGLGRVEVRRAEGRYRISANLRARADQVASPATVQVLLRHADALVEAARAEGRVGYQRAAETALAFPAAFRIAYLVYRHLGIQRFLAERLADRVELLLMMRLLVDRLVNFSDERLAAVFGKRLAELTGEIVEHRREDVNGAFDALHRQYPDYVATLEVRFLRQSALRQETRWYQALFEEGLIPQELYDDLKRGVARTRVAEPRPRFEIGLDTDRLIERLDILSGLDEGQLWRVAKLLRPRFTVPNERIIRQGDRGDAVFFIASGAVEMRLPARRIRLGSGEFFGEMALLFRAIAAGRCGRSDLLSAARVAKKPTSSASWQQIRKRERR